MSLRGSLNATNLDHDDEYEYGSSPPFSSFSGSNPQTQRKYCPLSIILIYLSNAPLIVVSNWVTRDRPSQTFWPSQSLPLPSLHSWNISNTIYLSFPEFKATQVPSFHQGLPLSTISLYTGCHQTTFPEILKVPSCLLKCRFLQDGRVSHYFSILMLLFFWSFCCSVIQGPLVESHM